MATPKYAGTVRAPDFPADVHWLNTREPLSLDDFAGKLLVIDFWTYCCINCMHIIPALRRLERDFPEELAVVGVHSAKFGQERATEHIRQAIMRYGVSHPVVNDADMRIWVSFAVRAWPTLMFVDPEGKIIGKLEGEMTYEQGAGLIGPMLEEFRTAGTLKHSPSRLSLEEVPAGVLSFPGKVLADPQAQRLLIADSGHHRVLVAGLDGRIQTTIGSGEEGFADGTLGGAQFLRPQGMVLDGANVLYVADTENHTVRRVDLEAGIVETIAGTGRQGAGRGAGGPATSVDLRSPWDLALVGRQLHIAMAGSHQLWVLDLESGQVSPSVGSGAENIVDGPAASAALAQPSGLAEEDGVLYFADSETSSIRAVGLAGSAMDLAGGEVRTLVGSGLFDFGDQDGGGKVAKLQHPLGVDVRDGVVYVADTYNSKIKRIAVSTLDVETIGGTGRPGHDDGPLETASFFEPGGLSVAAERIYVADTNNHAVRVIDTAAGMVSTLKVDY